MPNTNSKYQTLEGIQTHPCFGSLPPRQQEWVVEYCRTNGDRLKATHTVYPSTMKEHPRHDYAAEKITMLMRKPAIRTLIAAYFGEAAPPMEPTRQEMTFMIGTRLRDPELSNSEFLRLSQMLILMNEWQKPTDRVTKDLNMPNRAARRELEATAREETTLKTDDGINELVLEIEKAMKGGQ